MGSGDHMVGADGKGPVGPADCTDHLARPKGCGDPMGCPTGCGNPMGVRTFPWALTVSRAVAIP